VRRPRRLGALLGEIELAERWGAAALLALLAGCVPIGCGEASGPEQTAPWGEPFLSLGAQALPAWPTGSVQESPVMLVQRSFIPDDLREAFDAGHAGTLRFVVRAPSGTTVILDPVMVGFRIFSRRARSP